MKEFSQTMSAQFIEAVVDKLILLESQTGANVQYRLMEPFSTPFLDCLSIQMTAKAIAEFIGLNDYTFIITVAKQTHKVAGHIDLSTQGNNVYVEVDTDMMKFPDSVAATLCHELCHKWLQIRKINSPNKVENEILTDITSVYLGFGKIMLNGSESEKVERHTTPDGIQTIHEGISVGYLNRFQLAFVYCMVSAMRKIPLDDYMEGLNDEAMRTIQICTSLFGRHFDAHFHQATSQQGRTSDFMNQLKKVQGILADLNKHMTYIKKSLCKTSDRIVVNGHKQLKALSQQVVSSSHDNTLDPALRFLQAIKSEFDIKRLSEKANTVSKEANDILPTIREISHHLYQNGLYFPSPYPAMFNIVICPQDGTKLRLPESSGDIIVTCPTCKYRFTYDTTSISFSESSSILKLTWWQRICKFIGLQ